MTWEYCCWYSFLEDGDTHDEVEDKEDNPEDADNHEEEEDGTRGGWYACWSSWCVVSRCGCAEVGARRGFLRFSDYAMASVGKNPRNE